MWSAEKAVEELRRRGELWSPAPGQVALRGAALALRRGLEQELRAMCLSIADEEWLLPPAVPLQTLARADYFASFPQWLTVAAHLTDDEDRLLALAAAEPDGLEPAVARATAPAAAAMNPALCYHVYSACADSALGAPFSVTCDGTCWRHERDRLEPLERGWAFTMREIVNVGDEHAVAARLAAQRAAVVAFARRLGLRPDIEVAQDPFFAPSARGRAMLQRVKALKHELVLPMGNGGSVAAASFNHHERFFGEAFNITAADGTPATTGCTAFGVERWLLAVLVEHGVRPLGWPMLAAVETSMSEKVRGSTTLPFRPGRALEAL
jgi:seryl-tRNA synthetase